MFGKIVAAIDSDPSRSDTVVSVASEMAQAFEAEVLIVHVREMKRTAELAGVARPGALPPPLHMESEAEAATYVDGAVSRLRGAGLRAQGRVHSRCYGGSTAKALTEIALTYKASLIVVGDHGAPIVDRLLGGVAQKVAQAAPCPVLIVR